VPPEEIRSFIEPDTSSKIKILTGLVSSAPAGCGITSAAAASIAIMIMISAIRRQNRRTTVKIMVPLSPCPPHVSRSRKGEHDANP
jgi:hypothetical protein